MKLMGKKKLISTNNFSHVTILLIRIIQLTGYIPTSAYNVIRIGRVDLIMKLMGKRKLISSLGEFTAPIKRFFSFIQVSTVGSIM